MTERAPPHLVLVGLPGSGKTAVGRGVAARLGRPFIDFDEEIERREGRTIAEIFGLKGEPYFREVEVALSRELAGSSGMVLAPGGGWAAIPGVIGVLRPPARLVYLEVSPETALRRMAAERGKRPLLEGPEPLARLRETLVARERFYKMADDVVVVELLSLQGVIATVSSLAVGVGEG